VYGDVIFVKAYIWLHS